MIFIFNHNAISHESFFDTKQREKKRERETMSKYFLILSTLLEMLPLHVNKVRGYQQN